MLRSYRSMLGWSRSILRAYRSVIRWYLSSRR